MNTGVIFDLLMRHKIFYGKDNKVNPWQSNYVGYTYAGGTNVFIFATFF